MEITKIYKRTAVIVLILSLIHLSIFNINNLGMGLWITILTNAGFHGLYHFMSLVPPAQVKRLRRRNGVMGNLYKGMSQFMGIMAVFGGVAVAGIVTFDAINTDEYERLIPICLMAGLFLGGLKLFKNLEAE